MVSNLRRAARAASQALDRALADAGLTAGQFSVLVGLIALAASQHDPVTIGQLARRLAMDRTTLHRVLAPLRRAHLVDVTRQRGRRGSALAITAGAIDLVTAQRPHWLAVQRQFVATLGEGDTGRFLSLLDRIAQQSRSIKL